MTKRGFRSTLVAAITVALGVLLGTPAGVLAAKLTCLTGTDPSVATDLSQIMGVRAEIDAQCPCGSFDGSPGKTHGKYVTCANGVIQEQVSAGTLRSQCKTTVKKYYSASTCGVPASKGVVPCIKKIAAGKVTCAIKPRAKCVDGPGTYTQAACNGFNLCIDAADTNNQGIIDASDSGACAGTGTAFTLTSTAFHDGGVLPVAYTCDAADGGVSPPLQWTDAPEGTVEFALMMTTLALDGTKWNWVLFHVPANVTSLAQAAVGVGVAGLSSDGPERRYYPPCSTGPGAKTYTFTLYALSAAPTFAVPENQVTGEILTGAIGSLTIARRQVNVAYTRSGL